jgi:hypothetical protein
MGQRRWFRKATANLDSGAHAAGDTLFIANAIPCLNRKFRGYQKARITQLIYRTAGTVDVAPVFVFADTTFTVGNPNAAFALPAATNVLSIQIPGTLIAVPGGHSWQQYVDIGLSAVDDQNIYVAAFTTGTPTPGSNNTSTVHICVDYGDD